MKEISNKFVIFVLLLITPIFFSLQDGLYVGQNFQNEKILELPIPISFFILILISIILFLANIKQSYSFFNEKIVQIYLITFFIIIFINIFYFDFEYKKIFYLVQFFLPLLGLFVGYFFFENFFFLIIYRILFIYFSFHLLFSFLQGKFFLVPHLYIFEIYQNFQYVNATLVFLACISLMNIRKQIYKINFILYICLIFFYSFFCYSFSSIIIFAASLFLLLKSDFKKNYIKYFFLFLLFLFFFTILNRAVSDKELIGKNNINYVNNYQKFIKVVNLELPDSFTLRVHIFDTYIKDILEKNLLFLGSRSFELDKKYNGAHNLFIDSIYKFGILLAIPFFYLFIFIFFSIIKETDPQKKNILIIYFIFLLIENFFKVSLKQPYSGIISYYIFAILFFQKKN